MASQTDSTVTLAADVYPQLGYPFWLRTQVTYEVVADGVTVTHRIENLSASPAPIGIGAHPYLTIDDPQNPVAADQLLIRIPAEEYYVVDDRMLPTGTSPVAGTDYDVRSPRPLADLNLDTGYRAARDGSGSFESVVQAPDGRTVTLWQDPTFGYVQAYTKPDFVSAHGPIPAIAIEPMTCAVDAFNSGDGLRHLEPGETLDASWGIRFAR